MKLQIYLNTDGFLGAWGTVVTDPALAFEVPQADIPLFHKAIDGRDRISVLPRDSKKYDAAFGELKLNFGADQSGQLVKLTKEAHGLNAEKSGLEEALFT